jgi:O-antigen/teichoic acid export membrane protein
LTTRALRARPAATWRGRALGALRNPLYRGGYALILNTGATSLLGAAYWALAARLYDRQEVGRGSALVSALILVSSIAQLNLVNTLPRFLPLAGRAAGRLISYSYWVTSLTSLIGGAVFVTVLSPLNTQWKFLGGSAFLAALFVAGTLFWGVFALQDAALLGLRHPGVVPTENAAYGVCKLLLLAGIAWLLPSGGIFFSWVIPLAVIVPAVNWLIYHRYLKDEGLASAPAQFGAREVVRFASVDYVGSLLGQTYGNVLPLLVLAWLGAAANGSFYIAWTIAAAAEMVATNFATSMLVEGADAPERLAELTRGVLARCAAVTVPGTAVLILAARPVLSIYGTAYVAHASSLLGLLAVATIPRGLVDITFALDRIAGRVGRAAWSHLAVGVLVLGGSWLLVKWWGVDGVGLAWGGGNLIVAIVRLPTIVSAVRRRPAPSQPVPSGPVPSNPAASGPIPLWPPLSASAAFGMAPTVPLALLDIQERAQRLHDIQEHPQQAGRLRDPVPDVRERAQRTGSPRGPGAHRRSGRGHRPGRVRRQARGRHRLTAH